MCSSSKAPTSPRNWRTTSTRSARATPQWKSHDAARAARADPRPARIRAGAPAAWRAALSDLSEDEPLEHTRRQAAGGPELGRDHPIDRHGRRTASGLRLRALRRAADGDPVRRRDKKYTAHARL